MIKEPKEDCVNPSLKKSSYGRVSFHNNNLRIQVTDMNGHNNKILFVETDDDVVFKNPLRLYDKMRGIDNIIGTQIQLKFILECSYFFKVHFSIIYSVFFLVLRDVHFIFWCFVFPNCVFNWG